MYSIKFYLKIPKSLPKAPESLFLEYQRDSNIKVEILLDSSTLDIEKGVLGRIKIHDLQQATLGAIYCGLVRKERIKFGHKPIAFGKNYF